MTPETKFDYKLFYIQKKYHNMNVNMENLVYQCLFSGTISYIWPISPRCVRIYIVKITSIFSNLVPILLD